MPDNEPIKIRPILEVTTSGVTETVTPVYTIYPDGRVEQERVPLPGGAHELVVARPPVSSGVPAARTRGAMTAGPRD